jgi:hypothetical protein
MPARDGSGEIISLANRDAISATVYRALILDMENSFYRSLSRLSNCDATVVHLSSFY